MNRLPSLFLLFFSVLFGSLQSPALAGNVSFNFTSFSFLNLTLLGDSYLRNASAVGLTRETDVPLSSTGTAVCSLPVQFRDVRANVSASFSTRFSFSATSPNPGAQGDGLTFFISSNNATLGSAGAYLGLFNSSTGTGAVDGSSIVAIEFDSHLDAGFGDPSDNHVGLDVDSPLSSASADLVGHGVDLNSGKLIVAWIEYSHEEIMLQVWLSYSTTQPEDPVLSTKIDLSQHFQEYMYVGFSASTEGSTEVYTIEDWSFQTSGLPVTDLSTAVSSNAYNESRSSINPTMPIPGTNGGSHRKLSLGLAIICPVVSGVAFVIFAWMWFKKLMEIRANKKELSLDILKGPRRFSYKELSSATRGFHSSRVVGNGAFGTVYKAVVPGSGIAYAVKRSKHAHQSKSEFTAELSIIARLRHKNLVQLEGWCTEKNELFLVYEFMPNGSLDKVLYRSHELGRGLVLKWPQRYNVAVGIASVLAYLHQECEQQVIHRDIKTSNIMLDVNFNPRLGDFGLARLMDHNESPVSTLTAGTMGYLAPEYLQYGKATEKTDVFSYGVVILEVCCGRRPIDAKDSKDSKLVNLVDWVWGLHSQDKLIEAADQKLNGEFDKEEMLKFLLVGLSCANPNCAERPTMRRVLQILNSEAEPVPVPKMKPLLMFTSGASFSVQDIVSELEGI